MILSTFTPLLRPRFLIALALPLLIGLGITRCQEADRRGTASYFRLKVDLTYQGQPVGIDIVVACNVRVGRPIGGGTSIDTLGMSAFVFAREIPDGHAISVRSDPLLGGNRDPCRGATTANGGINPNFLPVVIWYDRVEDLSHGLAYVTRDAYRSPSARLVFGGAVVEAATQAEFKRFTATAKPNLIPYHLADVVSHSETPYIRKPEDVTPDLVAEPTRAWPRTSWTKCRAVRRWRVPSHLLGRVRQLWPADRPRIWAVDRKSGPDIFQWVEGGGSSALTGSGDYVVIPSVRDDGLSKLSAATFQDGTYYNDISTADAETRAGFAFCDRETPPPLFDAVTGRKSQNGDRLKLKCRMDGETVAVGWLCQDVRYLAFKDDEFVFTYFDPFED